LASWVNRLKATISGDDFIPVNAETVGVDFRSVRSLDDKRLRETENSDEPSAGSSEMFENIGVQTRDETLKYRRTFHIPHCC
jgi:hypothetical protein